MPLVFLFPFLSLTAFKANIPLLNQVDERCAAKVDRPFNVRPFCDSISFFRLTRAAEGCCYQIGEVVAALALHEASGRGVARGERPLLALGDERLEGCARQVDQRLADDWLVLALAPAGQSGRRLVLGRLAFRLLRAATTRLGAAGATPDSADAR